MRKLIALITTRGKSKKQISKEAKEVLKQKGIIRDNGEAKQSSNESNQDDNETKRQSKN